MSILGVYFGPNFFSVVTNKGKKIGDNFLIPQEKVSPAAGDTQPSGAEASEDLKTIGAFNEQIRKSAISASRAVVCLSGKELIVRTFELPVMPAAELEGAIVFEARKYCPFKLEDLVVGHQVAHDKNRGINNILLLAVRKDILSKYTSLFEQLKLKLVNVEYSAFSILRLLKLAGVSDKDTVAVVDVDPEEKDEANFVVMENGFPLFSRDLMLADALEAQEQPAGVDLALDKLKTELRVSVDYYNRKFPTKRISRLIFIAPQSQREALSGFAGEMGLVSDAVNVEAAFLQGQAFSLSLLKGFAASLSDTVKTQVRINLLEAKAKEIVAKEASIAALSKGSFLQDLKVNPQIVFLSVGICAAALALGVYQKQPLQKEIQDILATREVVSSINSEAAYEDLVAAHEEFTQKIKALDNLVKGQLVFSGPLAALPRLLPEGMWLRNLALSSEGSGNNVLRISGWAYAGDGSREFALVNSFAERLKQERAFADNFNTVTVGSLDRADIGGVAVTSFEIICRGRVKIGE